MIFKVLVMMLIILVFLVFVIKNFFCFNVFAVSSASFVLTRIASLFIDGLYCVILLNFVV